MTENKRFINEIGVEIICNGNLPVEIYNDETEETETFHMIQNGNAIFVSEELYSALQKRFSGDVE